MRRTGHLWPALVSFENLLLAAERSAAGKRGRPAVAAWHWDRERNLCRLQRQLQNQHWKPGGYTEFHVYEPRLRLISAAPYEDRVVHHALTQILGPIFETSFIADSYACRVGKGTHAAVRRAQQFSRRFPWVLKADIRKFFPSVDHQILLNLIARKIKDPQVQSLVELLVKQSNPQEAVLDWFPGDDLWTPAERMRGLPIGNQTSQFFANVYLDPLDHFVKEQLQVRGYVRYVDDFLLFAEDRHTLYRYKARIAQFLSSLRLKLHPTKCSVFPVRCGIRFLGYRVFPTHRLLTSEGVRRFRRRIRRLQRLFATGRISISDIQASLMSWLGHAGQADTHRLCNSLFSQIIFSRMSTEQPGVAGRFLQQ